MRRIHKGKPLPEFIEFKRRNPQEWNEIHVSGLSTKCRETILVYEQDCQSGYTEMPLDEKDETHIDHYKKKGMQEFSHLMFEWDNFVVDSRDTSYGACHKDKVIKNTTDYNTIFNPVTDDVEMYFHYRGDGEIIPKSEIPDTSVVKVKRTIEVFNLNHRTLKKKRADLIKLIDAYPSLDDYEIKSALNKCGFKSVVEQKLTERN
jgi:uncharacterized protein (TIGR02646 family)